MQFKDAHEFKRLAKMIKAVEKGRRREVVWLEAFTITVIGRTGHGIAFLDSFGNVLFNKWFMSSYVPFLMRLGAESIPFENLNDGKGVGIVSERCRIPASSFSL